MKPGTTILLSSLFTLFTTLWCCIRPDLPSYQDSKLRFILTKLNIIFWALLWPEAVLFWAVRQWLVAGRVAGEFQHLGWTRRHGLFLLMGGFVFCNNNGLPTKILSCSHLHRLLYQKAINLPLMNSSEIQERGNLHPSFALIALLQAVWFVTQSLSRFVDSRKGQGSPVTQLETITATLVVSCWFISIFAWKKPLDAKSPILVRPARLDLSTVHDCDRLQTQPSFSNDFEREENLLGSQIKECSFQLECPQLYVFRYISVRWPTRRALVSVLLWPFRSIYKDVNLLITRIEPNYDHPEFPDGTLKIPLFYVPDVSNMFMPVLFIPPIALLGLGMSAVSLLFVLPFDSTLYFPSEDVQLVWRIASIASVSFSTLTIGFLISGFFFSCCASCASWHLDDQVSICDIIVVIFGALFMLFFVTIIVGFVPFLLARLVLLVTSVICLKSVPAEALAGWSWTDYIPHFS